MSKIIQKILLIVSFIAWVEPQRYCSNVDLSAFCILDNQFKLLLENVTAGDLDYYERFKPVVTDIFDVDPWIDDDEDPGFAPVPKPNDTRDARKPGQSVYTFNDLCELDVSGYQPEGTGKGPAQFTPNPYQVKVTEVTVNGIRLHNHLHFEISSIPARVSGPATGRIKYAFIVVHDKRGFAIGDFDTGISCDEDRKPNKDSYQTNSSDTIPCMFTSTRSVTHPGQIIYFGGEAGVTKISTTWRFAQSTSPDSFATELHVKALLLENKDTITMKRDCRVDYGFTNLFPQNTTTDAKVCGSPTLRIPCEYISRTGKFGWTAKYPILWPTLKTLGAWDYFPRDFIKKRDIKCHNPINKAYFYTEEYPTYDLKKKLGPAPATCPAPESRPFKPGEDPNNGPLQIVGAQNNLYGKLSWEKDVQHYYGARSLSTYFTKDQQFLIQTNLRKQPRGTPRFGFSNFPTLKEIAEGERCRCPRKGTPPPKPSQRAPPVRQLEGRKDHAIQMTIAWIVLVPFAIFASRYYKETYSKVFFLQEYWWYTIHVLSLILAAMFMVGGIYAIEIKREDAFNYEDHNQLLHAILGGVALIFFAFHLVLGTQRLKKPEPRKIQIFLHWLFGILEYFLALFSMLNAAWIRAGCMSCYNFAFVAGWLAVQIAFYIVMEIHMRKVDKELQLVPKRSYLPPPVMRIFHVSAPGSKFRIAMLTGYFCACVFSYGLMHYFIEFTSAYRSCFNIDPIFEERIVQYQPN